MFLLLSFTSAVFAFAFAPLSTAFFLGVGLGTGTGFVSLPKWSEKHRAIPATSSISIRMSSSDVSPPASNVLEPEQRLKFDPSSDAYFYDTPRFCFHVDDAFVAKLTELYKERIPSGGSVLDLCSSWVSHLPSDVEYEKVDGHGMNAEELEKNPRLTSWVVKNLNEDPSLPFDGSQYDAVLMAVSIQYMQYPERIAAEIYRVLKPGGVAIISFSNRMFPTKAIQAWQERDDNGHAELVKSYFKSVQPATKDSIGFGEPEVVSSLGTVEEGDFEALARQLFAGIMGGGSDPFYAVVATKEGKSEK